MICLFIRFLLLLLFGSSTSTPIHSFDRYYKILFIGLKLFHNTLYGYLSFHTMSVPLFYLLSLSDTLPYVQQKLFVKIVGNMCTRVLVSFGTNLFFTFRITVNACIFNIFVFV